MKKYFATFLVLVATPAFAGGFNYDYEVNANALYGYSDYRSKYSFNHKQDHTPVSAEIYTSAGYDFDNGNSVLLGADAQISDGKQLADYNHGKWGENLYTSFSSAYGEISAGQIYNAAYQMAVGAPNVGLFRANNSAINDFIANPNWRREGHITAYRTLNSTYLNTDGDAIKFSYTSPEFYSTKLAFSYTPDSYTKSGLNNKYSRYAHRSSYAAGVYNNTDLDYVQLETSLGYAYNKKNNQEISAGASVYRKGWTVGGSYRKSFTNTDNYALNIRRNDDMLLYFDGFRKGQAFNVGVSYEIGPFKTGISYFAAYADETDNKDKIVTFANKFSFNKYAAVYLTGAYAEYKGADNKNSNAGYAAITGIELNF